MIVLRNSAGLFAALDPAIFIPTLALVGALLVAAVIIAFVRRWQQTHKTISPSASDQLAQFRILYEKGQISEEEYKRLRQVLGGEIRRLNDLPGKEPVPSVQPVAENIKNPDLPLSLEKDNRPE